MNLPTELLAALALAGQQVAENLFGPYLKGQLMRLTAIGITVGLAYGAWYMGLAGLSDLPAGKVGILGAFAGLGSNLVHGLMVRFAPASLQAPLAGMLARLRINGTNGGTAPPATQVPPIPPAR